MNRVETFMPVADDDDAVANLIERRWFAALTAIKTTQGECAVLQEVMDLAGDASRKARAYLVELEMLRDALGRQLTELDKKQSQARRLAGDRAELSAA
jgi:hypothetical protein